MIKKFHTIIGCLLISFIACLVLHKNNFAILPCARAHVRALIKKHSIKLIALYFPQFHPIPENDAFWGKDFTEWTLLKRFNGVAKMPHPDIGYYNMLDYATRAQQAQIAKKYGIYGFCYYHYWFKDKKVMHRGLEKLLEDGQPDLPFFLCWANEPWTRNWDGTNNEVLLPQEYGSEGDWIKHFEYLLKFFKHPLYIRENNCPILYIYRLEHIIKNQASAMLNLWKKLACQNGFAGLKIIAVLGGHSWLTSNVDAIVDGFAEHQPTFASRIWRKLSIDRAAHRMVVDTQAYINFITNTFKKRSTNYTSGIFFSWNNSPRRINKMSVQFSPLSLGAFEEFIATVVIRIGKMPNPYTNHILLNSWNEWTEQAMVEPNTIDGYSILEIIQKFFV